jgi:S1-C subfamily serine protease
MGHLTHLLFGASALSFLLTAVFAAPAHAVEGQALLRGGRVLYGELAHEFLLVNVDRQLLDLRASDIVKIQPELIELRDGNIVRGRLVGNVLRLRSSDGQDVRISLAELVEFRVLVREQGVRRKEQTASPGSTSSFGPPTGTPGLEALFGRLSPAVVIVNATGHDGTRFQGTGFVVSNRFVVTNYHVVEGAQSLAVRFSTGEQQPVSFVVAAIDTDWDLAVLVVGQMAPGVTPLLLDTGSVRVGQRVAVIGAPLGLALTLSDGLVSGLRGERTGELLQLTAPISEGSSGSPVLNLEGRVIGVATLYVTSGQNLNFAVPSARLEQLILQAGRIDSRSWMRLPLRGTREPTRETRPPAVSQPSSSGGAESLLNEAYVEVLPVLDVRDEARRLEERWATVSEEFTTVFGTLAREGFSGEELYRRSFILLAEMNRLTDEEDRMMQQMATIFERFDRKLQRLPMQYSSRYARIVDSYKRALRISRDAGRSLSIGTRQRAQEISVGGRPGSG